jgi:hypothetical protein
MSPAIQDRVSAQAWRAIRRRDALIELIRQNAVARCSSAETQQFDVRRLVNERLRSIQRISDAVWSLSRVGAI